MRWLIAIMGCGILFMGGTVLLAAAVVMRAAFKRRALRTFGMAMAAIAVMAIAVSATPLPVWLYVLWAASVAGWAFAPAIARRRRWAVLIEAAVLAVSAAAVGMELPFEVRPAIPGGTMPRMFVVGDSITAGIGRERGRTWPVVMRAEHQVEVVDLSHAGAGAAEELRKIERFPLSDGLVLLEIGGNDVIANADPKQFGRDLEALVKHVSGPDRVVLMLELPLFPFDNAYGMEQRAVARRHGIILIPRRFFAQVLSMPGATVDGIHLSQAGQRRMAEMIWGFVGTALQRVNPHSAHSISSAAAVRA